MKVAIFLNEKALDVVAIRQGSDQTEHAGADLPNSPSGLCRHRGMFCRPVLAPEVWGDRRCVHDIRVSILHELKRGLYSDSQSGRPRYRFATGLSMDRCKHRCRCVW